MVAPFQFKPDTSEQLRVSVDPQVQLGQHHVTPAPKFRQLELSNPVLRSPGSLVLERMPTSAQSAVYGREQEIAGK